jgi:hypothetical protein
MVSDELVYAPQQFNFNFCAKIGDRPIERWLGVYTMPTLEEVFVKYKSMVDALGLRGRSEKFLHAVINEGGITDLAITLFDNAHGKALIDSMEFLYELKGALNDKREGDSKTTQTRSAAAPSPALLDACRLFVSKAFKAVHPHTPTIREFFHQQDQSMILSVVRTIKMDESELTDYDMADILYVVKTYFDPSRFEGRLVVNLHSNQFGGSLGKDQAVYETFCVCLRELLALPQVKFVDVSGNPLVSLEHRAFLKTFGESDEASFLKMIWVSDALLETGEWKRLVRSESPGNMYAFTTLEHKIMASHGEYLSSSAKKDVGA